MTGRSMARGVALLAMLLAATGCTKGAGGTTADKADLHAPARLYPLAEGTVWTYDVDTGEGLPTLAITRVTSNDGKLVQVSSGSAPLTYEIRDEGLYQLDRAGWLLKAPVREGSSWDAGRGSTARVIEGAHMVTTMAGDFRECLTIEQAGGQSDVRVRTTYCPDVGPVRVESALMGQNGAERAVVVAQLRGYALHGM